MSNAKLVIDEWIETAKSFGRPIPQPKDRLAYAREERDGMAQADVMPKTSRKCNHMFVRDEGIMLGSGEVWFGTDGNMIAINN